MNACPRCKSTGGVSFKVQAVLDYICDWNGYGDGTVSETERKSSPKYVYCVECRKRILYTDWNKNHEQEGSYI